MPPSRDVRTDCSWTPARTQLDADEYTSGLRPVGEASSFGSFEPVTGQRTFTRHKAVAVDLSRVNSTLEYLMILILGYPTMRQAGWVFDFPAERWTLTE